MMSRMTELVEQGGPIMIPLVALSIILYQRCLTLLIRQVRLRRWIRSEASPLGAGDTTTVRQVERSVRDRFEQQMRPIGALVAAAPLLGLLGTVAGMVHTFESLASEGRGRSVEGLAEGISMALLTTETGLAVALPAMILIYWARRQMQIAIFHLATKGIDA